MATYYVYHGAGGTASGADWTNAFLTYAAAVAAATTNGDVIKVHKTHTEELGADTTYTHAANIAAICVDKDASDALATMGTAAWIGNSTTNRSIFIAGAAKSLYFYGLTFRCAGVTADHIVIGSSDGMDITMESCYLWQGITGSSSGIQFGSSDTQLSVVFRNSTLRFGSTSQSFRVGGNAYFEGGGISSAGSAPTTFLFFNNTSGLDVGGCAATFIGFDLSHLGSGTLFGDQSIATGVAKFIQCKLGSGYVAMAAQTLANRSTGECWIMDCASGDSHGLFGFYNALGSAVSDTGIYFTSGAAAQSWKIVTTSAANFYTPFVTPWLGYYNTGTSAITPYMEILRDGSATAYQDDEVWGEWAAKVTTGSTQATLYSDRMTLLGTPANQAAGAGLGSWTGETTTGAPDAWSGKVAPGSSFTPAENGHIQARLCVGEPSITVYLDPQIRT